MNWSALKGKKTVDSSTVNYLKVKFKLLTIQLIAFINPNVNILKVYSSEIKTDMDKM